MQTGVMKTCSQNPKCGLSYTNVINKWQIQAYLSKKNIIFFKIFYFFLYIDEN